MKIISHFEQWVADRWVLARGRRLHTVPYSAVAALGLAGEAGEVVEHLKKHLRDGKHPGRALLLLELGDLHHYTVVIAQAYGWTMREVEYANTIKLVERDHAAQQAPPVRGNNMTEF